MPPIIGLYTHIYYYNILARCNVAAVVVNRIVYKLYQHKDKVDDTEFV